MIAFILKGNARQKNIHKSQAFVLTE